MDSMSEERTRRTWTREEVEREERAQRARPPRRGEGRFAQPRRRRRAHGVRSPVRRGVPARREGVTEVLNPEPLLRALHEADVRHVIIGGFAVNAHGVIRPSKDLDIVPDPERSRASW